MSLIKVLIADDIPQTCSEIHRLLSFEDDIKVIGMAHDGEQAIKLTEELNPDVVIMDINMPVMNGIMATEQISIKMPQVATIMISIQGEADYLKKAMRAGAREYLVKPLDTGELVTVVRKVYQMERSRHTAREQVLSGATKPQQAKLVVVFSPKGGVGKTTVATNLGVALSQSQAGRVALVDLDLQFGDVGLMLNLDTKRSISELAKEEEIDAEIVQTYLVSHFSGLRVMVGPNSPQDAELVTADRVKQVLTLLSQQVDWIVVDTAPGITDLCLDVLDACDKIILLVTPDLATVKSVRLCLQVLKSLNLQHKVLVVANRHDVKLGLKSAELTRGMGVPVWKQIPNDEATVIEAVNKGIPFVLGHGFAQIAESIKLIANAIMQEEGLNPQASTKSKGLFGKILNK